MCKIGQAIETENRLVGTRGQVIRGDGCECTKHVNMLKIPNCML